MIRASLLPSFATLIICGVCSREFVSLESHSWRFKSKVGYNDDSTANNTPVMQIATKECLPVKSCKAVKCCCGKMYKGARGLKMHQRSCRGIDNFEDELQQQMAQVFNNHHNEDNVDQVTPQNSSINYPENFPDLKKGINLPKSPSHWAIAYEFFKITFSNHLIIPQDLNNSINTMATVMYNYFSENFGFVDGNISNVQFQSKYKTFSTKHLKNTLKKLKLEDGNMTEIKFVAKKLRNILNKPDNTDEHNNNNYTAEVHHDCPMDLSPITLKF